MSARHARIAAAVAGVIGMAAIASAEPANQAEMPLGDVWVTPDGPGPLPSHAAQNTPTRQLPIGDFWPTEDDLRRAADVPAPAQPTKSARENSATGSMER